jgi:peptidyl-dipeptidase Dcp
MTFKSLKLTLLFLIVTLSMANANPFMQEFDLKFSAVPFDKIELNHYAEALEAGLKQQEEDIQKIVENTQAPTFENTILALENSGAILSRVCGVLFNLTEAETCDELDSISEKYSPILSEASSKIKQNEALFARVKKVYENIDQYADPIQKKMIEDSYIGFVRSGANLEADKKERLKTLSSELSLLTFNFGRLALQATNAYTMHLTNIEDLDGLPEYAIAAAKQKATEKGLEGWIIDLSAPSYISFMQYATNRALRKELYMAYNTKTSKGDENDNQENIKKIVNNRLEMAQIMGRSHYSEYRLERTMAQNDSAVYGLLDDLLEKYMPHAIEEREIIQKYAGFPLMPYDWAFYSEKYKEEKYNYKEEDLKPYFELERVKKGVFGLATDLYGIKFVPNKELPVYHKDVDLFEVYDANDKFMGLLYTDFFPRKSKRQGAWMTEFKGQYYNADGTDSRPLISLVMNFTPPTEGMPALLTYDEVKTFLHEFGHALHGLLSDVPYESLSGTNVYRDFVELPSQIMENFASLPEFLNKTAIHYQTGEVIPTELVEKVKASEQYLAAYSCIRQLSFGYLDMAWHGIKENFDGNVIEFEKNAWKKTQLFPSIDGCCMSTHFTHLFAGGYAAGYYGYKWAEVLDADAFSVFQEAGGIDKTVASRFRDNILSKGGTEHPMELYIKFRGGKPQTNALLKRDGIIK